MPEPRRGVDTRLAKALSHPVRVQALKILNERVASPSDIARDLELPIANVSYHVKTLLQLGCIEEVEYRHVRGAVEHRYRAIRRPDAQLDDWADMPTNAREDLLGKIAQAAFNDLRAAQEEGALGACDHPLYGWTRLRMDDETWMTVREIMDTAMREAIALAEASAAKLVDEGASSRRAALSVFLHPLASDPPDAPEAVRF